MKIAIDSKQVEIRKLDLKRTDILCLKRPKHMRDQRWGELLNMFANDLVNYLGFRTIVIGVDRNWNEITKLDEGQMALYGWVPRSKVLAMKDDPVDEVFELVKELKELAAVDEALARAKASIEEEE